MAQCETCGRELTRRDSDSENCRRCALRFSTQRSNNKAYVVLVVIGIAALIYLLL